MAISVKAGEMKDQSISEVFLIYQQSESQECRRAKSFNSECAPMCMKCSFAVKR